ncbi:hypothetical protein AVEN_162475-1, partial [Araneus ventricosus]
MMKCIDEPEYDEIDLNAGSGDPSLMVEKPRPDEGERAV